MVAISISFAIIHNRMARLAWPFFLVFYPHVCIYGTSYQVFLNNMRFWAFLHPYLSTLRRYVYLFNLIALFLPFMPRRPIQFVNKVFNQSRLVVVKHSPERFYYVISNQFISSVLFANGLQQR